MQQEWEDEYYPLLPFFWKKVINVGCFLLLASGCFLIGFFCGGVFSFFFFSFIGDFSLSGVRSLSDIMMAESPSSSFT